MADCGTFRDRPLLTGSQQSGLRLASRELPQEGAECPQFRARSGRQLMAGSNCSSRRPTADQRGQRGPGWTSTLWQPG
jgi:hypothetical protein